MPCVQSAILSVSFNGSWAHRQKYLVSAWAFLTGKFCVSGKLLHKEHIFSQRAIFLSRISVKKQFGSSGNIVNCFRHFQLIWKKIMISDHIETFHIFRRFLASLKRIETTWKVSECLESFQIIWKISCKSLLIVRRFNQIIILTSWKVHHRKYIIKSHLIILHVFLHGTQSFGLYVSRVATNKTAGRPRRRRRPLIRLLGDPGGGRGH